MKPLDTTLRSLTGYRLQRTTSVSILRFKEVFAAHGLRRTTFSCLSLIVETPGLRQSQLGEALAIERPNLVSVIEDLHSQGLIQKKASPTDRRAYELSATTKGMKRFKEAYADVCELDAEIVDGLSDDESDVLMRALQKIERNAKALKSKGPG